METLWIEIRDAAGTRREALRPGLTRIGGRGADVALPDAGDDQLQIADDPPRMVHVGAGPAPELRGAGVEESALEPGDVLAWCGVEIAYLGSQVQARLEELPRAELELEAPAAFAEHPRAWKRVRAGMLVELGLADKTVARHWQDQVRAGSFQADRCAEEIESAEGTVADDARLEDRASRLQRDLLMSPLLRGSRGASRKAREGARSMAALGVAQLLGFLAYSVLVFLLLLVARYKGFEIDGLLDGILAPLTGESGGAPGTP